MKGTRRISRTHGPAARGFTLVELLVAVALGVIVLSIVAVVFGQTTTVFNDATARIEALQNGRVALDLIQQDLEAAVIDPAGRQFIGVPNGTSLGLTAATPALWFTTMNAGDGGGKVLYYLQDAPTGTTFSPDAKWLMRAADTTTISALESTDIPLTTDGIMIAYGIKSLEISYLGSITAGPNVYPRWFTDWNAVTGLVTEGKRLHLPQAVRIRLEVIDRKGRLAKSGKKPVVLERLITPGARSNVE